MPRAYPIKNCSACGKPLEPFRTKAAKLCLECYEKKVKETKKVWQQRKRFRIKNTARIGSVV